ncbi:MAG: hypothetical protein KA191_06100 [Verrucomicrobia bacterium]|nr:hypothetical protein [Verrucomicrobiota bacterium]OQC67568.1 MAG: hypothetical protein BWX48_00674 [Verrucomicrobia bacterium ADurb.Bin006]MDI9382549.1 hypothetical protein [Verrucomicrobiota bacterium]NMD18672.1 hypothetical protein [Verrucomicrobiota bacterium]HOA60874.1 hypothetical protein [Verrucomicrobiota bacterium]
MRNDSRRRKDALSTPHPCVLPSPPAQGPNRERPARIERTPPRWASTAFPLGPPQFALIGIFGPGIVRQHE